MKFFIYSTCILTFLLLVSLATGISHAQVNQATDSSKINQSETFLLREEVVRLRDENYQHAIKIAEQAGQKADRLLNWIVGLTTITGFVILAVTFTIGKNLNDLRNELRLHVEAARKSVKLINNIALEAQEKGEKLKSEISKIQSLKENLAVSKGKAEEQEVKLTELLNQAQGTISEIQSLKNSAALVSGTTLSYPPYTSVNISEPIGPFEGNTKKCKKCGNSLPFNVEGYVPYGDPDICFSCKMKVQRGE